MNKDDLMFIRIPSHIPLSEIEKALESNGLTLVEMKNYYAIGTIPEFLKVGSEVELPFFLKKQAE